jgi:hypothetical protein
MMLWSLLIYVKHISRLVQHLFIFKFTVKFKIFATQPFLNLLNKKGPSDLRLLFSKFKNGWSSRVRQYFTNDGMWSKNYLTNEFLLFYTKYYFGVAKKLLVFISALYLYTFEQFA